jgi:starvation-inducible outer membrane lipoprotein
MKRHVMIALAVALSGCVETPPVVADFNGDSVKVVTIAWTSAEPTAATAVEATRVCRAGGKSRAEYASTRVNPQNYEATHLYLCL